jgi:hypothetical protein
MLYMCHVHVHVTTSTFHVHVHVHVVHVTLRAWVAACLQVLIETVPTALEARHPLADSPLAVPQGRDDDARAKESALLIPINDGADLHHPGSLSWSEQATHRNPSPNPNPDRNPDRNPNLNPNPNPNQTRAGPLTATLAVALTLTLTRVPLWP